MGAGIAKMLRGGGWRRSFRGFCCWSLLPELSSRISLSVDIVHDLGVGSDGCEMFLPGHLRSSLPRLKLPGPHLALGHCLLTSELAVQDSPFHDIIFKCMLLY
jgi:hypothetical protein